MVGFIQYRSFTGKIVINFFQVVVEGWLVFLFSTHYNYRSRLYGWIAVETGAEFLIDTSSSWNLKLVKNSFFTVVRKVF
jgi:ABC-type anion transport system duplicated permease subunit